MSGKLELSSREAAVAVETSLINNVSLALVVYRSYNINILHRNCVKNLIKL